MLGHSYTSEHDESCLCEFPVMYEALKSSYNDNTLHWWRGPAHQD